MQYRAKIGLAVCGFALALLPVASHAAEAQKIAVVNVSQVFENYLKVPDIQKRIDAIHEEKKKELNSRGKDLAERNSQLEAMYKQSGSQTSLSVFDAVQALRRQQYLYEQDVNTLNMQIQKDYTREMREVLSDIRQSIRVLAEANGYEMVLRSPDSDNPKPVAPPSGKSLTDPSDKRTLLQKEEAKSTLELIERFNRNPVLYGRQTVDISDDVLKIINGKFMSKSVLPNAGGK